MGPGPKISPLSTPTTLVYKPSPSLTESRLFSLILGLRRCRQRGKMPPRGRERGEASGWGGAGQHRWMKGKKERLPRAPEAVSEQMMQSV